MNKNHPFCRSLLKKISEQLESLNKIRTKIFCARSSYRRR